MTPPVGGRYRKVNGVWGRVPTVAEFEAYTGAHFDLEIARRIAVSLGVLPIEVPSL